MPEAYQDKIDLEARKRGINVMNGTFSKLLESLESGKELKLVIPKRTLTNTIFDPEKGILKLGVSKLERRFLDMNEARRFMQTLVMASLATLRLSSVSHTSNVTALMAMRAPHSEDRPPRHFRLSRGGQAPWP